MPSSLLLLCFFLCRSCSLTAGWLAAAAVLLLPSPVLLLPCSGADMDGAKDGTAVTRAATAGVLCSVVSWVADTWNHVADTQAAALSLKGEATDAADWH
jgi:hypothetical protein